MVLQALAAVGMPVCPPFTATAGVTAGGGGGERGGGGGGEGRGGRERGGGGLCLKDGNR